MNKVNTLHLIGGYVVCFMTMMACAPISLTSTQVYQGSSSNNIEGKESVKKDLALVLKSALVDTKELRTNTFYPSNVVVTDDSITVMKSKSKKFAFKITELPEISVSDWGRNGPVDGHFRYSVDLPKTRFSWSDLKKSQEFADGLTFFRQLYITKRSEEGLKTFEPVAAKYRVLKIKPPVLEEQRKYIVQATALAQQKKYKEAIELYDKAIDFDPTNPITYYNQSLLLAQVLRYNDAIYQMKRYLLLAPDAADARSAQDKIYEWEITGKK
ncbi:MAG: tetratricopeptide repeat protein [Bacteroidota bacterium]|nr:tetratricopeptide repeat protein [Bacteroidota bacterium]